MADLHREFQKFNQALSIKGNRLSRLQSSKDAVQNAVIKHFKTDPQLPVPKFRLQGSYKMGTIILKKDNTYDVDLGIYFEQMTSLTAKTLQANVLKAVRTHTSQGAQHKERCIRVVYAGEFNIDLPVYLSPSGKPHPSLATKSGWIVSNPKELMDWFAKRKNNNGQLTRVVKYLKAWANARSSKMPSGIALSVWAAKHFVPDKRDDIALIKTAKAIRSSFFLGQVVCKCPATPNDDLVERLDSNQKRNFKKALDNLIEQGDFAIKHKEAKSAKNIWALLFGKWFKLAVI